MSNANLVGRIESLLRSLERSELSLQTVARAFMAHCEALEYIEYSSIKDAQMAAVDFDIDGEMDADGFGNHDQMVVDTVRWVLDWLSSVPR